MSGLITVETVPMGQKQFQELYRWIDKIELTRAKKDIKRDFADGVLMAEVVCHFFPRFVDLHNYSANTSVEGKTYNWQTLNEKVFRKMGFQVSAKDIDNVVNCNKGAIESVLYGVQLQMLRFQNERAGGGGSSDRGGSKPGRSSKPRSAKPKRDYSPQRSPQNRRSRSPDPPPRRQNREPRREKRQPEPERSGRGRNGGGRSSGGGRGGGGDDKDRIIESLRETIELLSEKVAKLQQLSALKTTKIRQLEQTMETMR